MKTAYFLTAALLCLIAFPSCLIEAREQFSVFGLTNDARVKVVPLPPDNDESRSGEHVITYHLKAY